MNRQFIKQKNIIKITLPVVSLLLITGTMQETVNGYVTPQDHQLLVQNHANGISVRDIQFSEINSGYEDSNLATSQPAISVSTWGELQAAVASAATNGSLTIIELTADINSDDTLTIAGGRNITLLGNYTLNRGLSGEDFGRVVFVSADSTFTLGNEGAGPTITGGNGEAFPMVIDGVTVQVPPLQGHFGAGVFIDTGGTFIMNGGEISGNVGTNAGGVYANRGSEFILNDGLITGNISHGHGGGVGIHAMAIATMNGGTITRNRAEIFAGGLWRNNEHDGFTMNGGYIYANTLPARMQVQNIFPPDASIMNVVTFDPDGGAFPGMHPGLTKTRQTGLQPGYDGYSMYQLPEEPTKPGYTFVGWFGMAAGSAEVTTSTIRPPRTVFARWEEGEPETTAPETTAPETEEPTEPETGTTAPETGTEEPSEPETGTTAPETGTTAPETGTTAPETGTDEPLTGTTAPEEPSESETGTTAPETGTTAPETETTAPETGTTAPEEGTTAPEEGTTAPEEGTTAPEEGTTAPEEGTTAPPSDDFEFEWRDNNNVFVLGESTELVIVVEGRDISDFSALYVNNNQLEEQVHFTLESGSVIITLLGSYLNDLEAGTHQADVRFGEAVLSGDFEIRSQQSTTAPEEGTTAPEEGTTAPEEGTTAPEEGTAEPSEPATGTEPGTAPETGTEPIEPGTEPGTEPATGTEPGTDPDAGSRPDTGTGPGLPQTGAVAGISILGGTALVALGAAFAAKKKKKIK